MNPTKIFRKLILEIILRPTLTGFSSCIYLHKKIQSNWCSQILMSSKIVAPSFQNLSNGAQNTRGPTPAYHCSAIPEASFFNTISSFVINRVQALGDRRGFYSVTNLNWNTSISVSLLLHPKIHWKGTPCC